MILSSSILLHTSFITNSSHFSKCHFATSDGFSQIASHISGLIKIIETFNCECCKKWIPVSKPNEFVIHHNSLLLGWIGYSRKQVHTTYWGLGLSKSRSIFVLGMWWRKDSRFHGTIFSSKFTFHVFLNMNITFPVMFKFPSSLKHHTAAST